MYIEDVFLAILVGIASVMMLVSLVIIGGKGYVEYQQHVYCKKQEAKPYYACMKYQGKQDIGIGKEEF